MTDRFEPALVELSKAAPIDVCREVVVMAANLIHTSSLRDDPDEYEEALKCLQVLREEVRGIGPKTLSESFLRGTVSSWISDGIGILSVMKEERNAERSGTVQDS